MHSQSAACICQVGWSFISETEKHDEERQSAESLHQTWNSSVSRRRWALPERSETKHKASLRRVLLWKVWMCIRTFQFCCVAKRTTFPAKKDRKEHACAHLPFFCIQGLKEPAGHFTRQNTNMKDQGSSDDLIPKMFLWMLVCMGSSCETSSSEFQCLILITIYYRVLCL